MSSQQADDFEKQREMIHINMLSSVSHDLKTPLASVIGSLEIHERMKDKLSQDKKEALIATALQEAYRLDNFVTNILEMAKLENGMVKVQHETCYISSLINDCRIKLGHRLKDAKVEIEAVNGEVIVQTDPALLSRAVIQVLDNAIKYGGSPAIVHIEYELEGDLCVIKIHDNGKGLTENQKQSVFAKYTRFAKQDQQAAGTGLGLSISKEIMRLLGGSIEAYPAYYKENMAGASFIIKLPKSKM